MFDLTCPITNDDSLQSSNTADVTKISNKMLIENLLQIKLNFEQQYGRAGSLVLSDDSINFNDNKNDNLNEILDDNQPVSQQQQSKSNQLLKQSCAKHYLLDDNMNLTDILCPYAHHFSGSKAANPISTATVSSKGPFSSRLTSNKSASATNQSNSVLSTSPPTTIANPNSASIVNPNSASVAAITNSNNSKSSSGNVDRISTKVVVKSSAHVSYIVGKQGSKIRQIRQDTNTFIQTPVNGEEPIFVISGKQSNVILAKAKLEEAAKEFDFNIFVEACTYRDGDKIRFNLFLPSRFIGLVVGKKGTIIKRIMELTETTIVTPKVNTLNGFKIHGRPNQIRQAIDMIKEHILLTTNNMVQIEEWQQNQVEITLVIKDKLTTQ